MRTMPKKTKKEKIIAEYRKKLTTIRAEDSASPYAYRIPPDMTSRTIAIQPMDQAIRRDLIKTLLLAVIAIGGEIALSMAIGT